MIVLWWLSERLSPREDRRSSKTDPSKTYWAVGVPIVIGKTDDQAREEIKKKGWKAKLDRRRRFARGAPASPARPRSAG